MWGSWIGQRPLKGKGAMEVGPRKPLPLRDGECEDGACTLPASNSSNPHLYFPIKHLIWFSWGGREQADKIITIVVHNLQMRKMNLTKIKQLSQRHTDSKQSNLARSRNPNSKPQARCIRCPLSPTLYPHDRQELFSTVTLSHHSLLKKLQEPHCLAKVQVLPGFGLQSPQQPGSFLASAPSFLSLNFAASVPASPSISPDTWHSLWTLSLCTFCSLSLE